MSGITTYNGFIIATEPKKELKVKELEEQLFKHPDFSPSYKEMWSTFTDENKKEVALYFLNTEYPDLPLTLTERVTPVSQAFLAALEHIRKEFFARGERLLAEGAAGGSRRRRRSIPKSSRKFKKSSKRVFRKKSRATRRR